MTLAEAVTLVGELAFERSDVERLLEVSAGKDADENVAYRPYIVAAVLWRSSPNTARLQEAAGGTRFESSRVAIRELLAMQAPWDAQLTDIPEEWTVEALRRAAAADTFEVVF